jgi:hypothetical protein
MPYALFLIERTGARMFLLTERKVAFRCVRCGEAIGDPAYRGPCGHAPQSVCFTCWVNAFEQPPWHWPREVLALWFLANGHSRSESARLAGMHRTMLWRVLGRARKNFSEFQEIVQHFPDICAIRRLRRGRGAR